MKPYKEPEIQRKLTIIKDIILNTVPNTVAIYLFGSYAYGIPHKYSDLDIFILIPEQIADEYQLERQIKVAIRMEIDKFMALDVYVNDLKSFQKKLKYASIDKTIAIKGIKIYG